MKKKIIVTKVPRCSAWYLQREFFIGRKFIMYPDGYIRCYLKEDIRAVKKQGWSNAIGFLIDDVQYKEVA